MHWSHCDIASFSPQELEKIYKALSPSRKEYIDRLRRSRDKNRSLAAELLVYRLLQKHYGICGAQLQRKDTGAPYLTGCSLFVSISHSDEKVACAVSETPVGIDIEKIRPINLRICRHVCVDAEKAYIGPAADGDAVCRDPQVLHRFFQIWTAKEAYFKQQGTGITDLKSIDVTDVLHRSQVINDYVIHVI